MRECLLLIALLMLLIENVYSNDKIIAITIDDAPMASSMVFSGLERTKKIMRDLQVPAAVFVIGENIATKSGRDRLKLYDEAGYTIANHSYSHYGCSKVTAEEFINDIIKADSLLRNYENFEPIFRYPYLDECRSQEKRDKVSSFLKENGYVNGYVTIVTSDWYINKLLQKALSQGKKINYSKLQDLYLKLMIGYVNYYYNFYLEKLGYSPPHSLLLHENDLTALYIKDLVKLLKEEGWVFIKTEEIYKNQDIVKEVNEARKHLPTFNSLNGKYIDRLFKEVLQ
jgi:peptidoglycan/xylan/chitin deacetylase (PgdA/CDA1 family)